MITVYITDIENGKLGKCQEFSFSDRNKYTEFCDSYWRTASIIALDRWTDMDAQERKLGGNYQLAWKEIGDFEDKYDE
jgi:hypothetical protein